VSGATIAQNASSAEHMTLAERTARRPVSAIGAALGRAQRKYPQTPPPRSPSTADSLMIVSSGRPRVPHDRRNNRQ
jgi:hypothetical protein